MPTISIEMFPGRTPEQKVHLVKSITDATVETLGVDPVLVKIKLYEIPAYHSAQGGVLAQQPPPQAE